ncbi:Gfo/Idh/MocA family oxidoreductase [Isoptericola sp. NEAU-Y5]|uniref:Gfo/Idh/MocA family oxidoreductase n=1 Tax=Isoptericola luteus TaxID=2879484 RepID=A0ABS7ZCC3_9MICO|nr:Gfo/Idh/MocA family oxidoreductase [Isoptericola sp. NEAU-Y5]MCA5891951.1 Gfo/Idh/MocA family oxidoreductase [Isoptericola sp. NEAU-Y5]
MGEPLSRSGAVGVGIVGLGVISRQYLDTLTGHPGVRVAAVTDLDRSRAEAVAAGLPGARVAHDLDALVSDDEVEVVLDLTTPGVHAHVAKACVAAGVDRYGEKPLAADLAASREVMATAAAAGVRVGCAPDSVLGTGVQTARAAVADGLIGTPTSAVATWVSPGHEAWHPHPDFYYALGGGPLLDMGPYYLTSLVQILGPVAWVQGAASRSRDVRTVGTGPRAGEQVPVEVATHVTGVLAHTSGALSTVTMSFDAVASRSRPIEVHGTAGSLAVPDPNHFDGDVELLRAGSSAWEVLPPSAGFAGAGRGVGLLEMVGAVGLGAAPASPRAGGDVGLHAMEVMAGLLASADDGRRVGLTTAPAVPPLVPLTPAASWRRTGEVAR